MTTPTPLKTKIAPIAAKGPREPRAVREDTGLSVPQMAELIGMSVQGYEFWENGLRRPGGPARRLLQLIDNDVKAVRDVLQ